MGAKEKRKISKIVFLIGFFMIVIMLIYIKNVNSKESYATDEKVLDEANLRISNAKAIDIKEIIQKNTKNKKEEIYEKQEELEYITKYRNNDELYKGTTKVSQEGKNGIQTIIMKKNYDDNGNVINEEQVGCVVTKSSINKIIDIGTKIYVQPEQSAKTSNTNITMDIELNKPSGFTEEQFKHLATIRGLIKRVYPITVAADPALTNRCSTQGAKTSLKSLAELAKQQMTILENMYSQECAAILETDCKSKSKSAETSYFSS